MTTVLEHSPAAGRAAHSGERPPLPSVRARTWPLALPGLAACLVPLLASTALAIAGGWIPAADVAIIAMRAADTFSSHILLTGVHTTASEFTPDAVVFHPGPLPVWVLAPTYVMAQRHPWGLLVGTLIVNAACVFAVFWIARRRGGLPLAAWSTVPLSLMFWALRGEIIRDPWNPHLALMPFVVFLYSCWSVRVGDEKLLPLLLLAGSFVTQAHVTYAPVVGMFSLWALVGLARHVRRKGSADRTRRYRRWAWSAALVVFVWAGPLVDQFFGGGNLTKLAGVVVDPEVERLGLRRGLERALVAYGSPPVWLSHTRSVFRIATTPDLPDLLVASFTVSALLALWTLARREKAHTTAAGLEAALLGMIAVPVLLARAPATTNAFEIYWYRWLWPMGMFTWTALGWAAWRAANLKVGRPSAAATVRWLAAAGAVLTLIGLLQPPLREDREGPWYDTLRRFSEDLALVLPPDEPAWRLDGEGQLFWHVSTVAAILERHGHHVVVDPATRIAWGDHRKDRFFARKVILVGGAKARVMPKRHPRPDAANRGEAERSYFDPWRLVAFLPIRSPGLAEREAALRRLYAQGVDFVDDIDRLVRRLEDGEQPEAIAAELNLQEVDPRLGQFFWWLVDEVGAGRVTSAGEMARPDFTKLPGGTLLWAYRFGVFVEPKPGPDLARFLETDPDDPYSEAGFDLSPDSGFAAHMEALDPDDSDATAASGTANRGD
ncbi:MAG: hypothetical protein KatS3mg008_0418 [Acidimicrobiales bacterium]|nr:MAG: hypothetical protein KatS3mg008_0418 [Acidimicrobiales bacterium]